jgi:hypothetical protein
VLFYVLDLRYARADGLDAAPRTRDNPAGDGHSRNWYWLGAPDAPPQSFAALGALRHGQARRRLAVVCAARGAGAPGAGAPGACGLEATCTVSNPLDGPEGPGLAIAARWRLARRVGELERGGGSGDGAPADGAPADARVLPTFYSDSYVSLLPGEATTVEVSAPAGNGGAPPGPAGGAKSMGQQLRGWACVDGRAVERQGACGRPGAGRGSVAALRGAGTRETPRAGPSLRPGPPSDARGAALVVEVDGWNIAAQTVPVLCGLGKAPADGARERAPAAAAAAPGSGPRGEPAAALKVDRREGTLSRAPWSAAGHGTIS